MPLPSAGSCIAKTCSSAASVCTFACQAVPPATLDLTATSLPLSCFVLPGAPLPRAGIAACAFCGKLAPAGQLRTCGSCKRVAYCSRDCQVCRMWWPERWRSLQKLCLASGQCLIECRASCRLSHLWRIVTASSFNPKRMPSCFTFLLLQVKDWKQGGHKQQCLEAGTGGQAADAGLAAAAESAPDGAAAAAGEMHDDAQ